MPAGRIVHANAAGNTMLAAADFLRRTACGRLVAGDAPVNTALREILLAAGAGDAALGVKGIALPLTARKRRTLRRSRVAADLGRTP